MVEMNANRTEPCSSSPPGQSWPLSSEATAQDVLGKPGTGGHQGKAPRREVRTGFAKASLWFRKLLRHRRKEEPYRRKDQRRGLGLRTQLPLKELIWERLSK